MLLDDKIDLVLYIKHLIDIVNSGYDLSNMDMVYVNILMDGDQDAIQNLETYLKCKKKLDLYVLEMVRYINE
jgi:hypothetical protein